MTQEPAASLCIEGDYLDSFVYSGTLFLVDSKSRLTLYRWDQIVEKVFDGCSNSGVCSHVPLLLSNHQRYLTMPNAVMAPIEPLKLCVSSAILAGAEMMSVELGVWPTDLDISSNVLYVSSEEGVRAYQLTWDKRIAGISDSVNIVEQGAFRVSSNTWRRVAVAGGKEGLLTVTHHGTRPDKCDIRIISEAPCTDCDWKDTTLVGNTVNGAIKAEYEPLPAYDVKYGSRNDYRRTMESLVKRPPLSITDLEIGGNRALFSWLGGGRVFALDSKLNLLASDTLMNETADVSPPLASFSKLGSVAGEWGGDVLACRSSAFGTMVELSDALLVISESGIARVSAAPVRWRNFPRAKHYANHLHIVEEAFLRIAAFRLTQKDGAFDRYGFSLLRDENREDGNDEARP